jgi:hypothetical protein
VSDTVYRIVDTTEKLSRLGYEAVADPYSISYYYNGLLHREDDVPAYEDFNGTKKWYVDGELHRIKGPAVIFTSSGVESKVYYLRGNEIRGKDLIDLKKFISSPLEDMPLFINHSLLKDYAKEVLEAGVT